MASVRLEAMAMSFRPTWRQGNMEQDEGNPSLFKVAEIFIIKALTCSKGNMRVSTHITFLTYQRGPPLSIHTLHVTYTAITQ